MNIQAYHRQQKQMAKCQADYDFMLPDFQEEADDFITDDEIEDAKLELQLERLEAIEQGQWFN